MPPDPPRSPDLPDPPLPPDPPDRYGYGAARDAAGAHCQSQDLNFADGSVTRYRTYGDGSKSIAELHPPGWTRPEGSAGAATGACDAARRLATAQAGTLRWDPSASAWLAWDGALWRRTDPAGVRRLVAEALAAAGEADPRPSRVAAAEAYARHDPALRLSPDDGVSWDADPVLLGTPGGTVDLRTGRLRPAAPADRLTRSTAVAPAERGSAAAACPLWRRFLADCTGGDPATAAFLQRFCGYGLTGDTGEHALLFLHGAGGNGKSVFANTLRALAGSYAAVAAPDLLAHTVRSGGKAHSAEIAMLAGARLVFAAEAEEGRVWAEGRLKLLTGGDPVTARYPGRDPFTFTPRFKLVGTGNHLPALRTVDAALARRLCVVPFAHRPDAPDRALMAKLRAEWPGILRWMIEGCLAWQAEGLGRPPAVAAATADYLGDQDLMAQFVAEFCLRAPTARVPALDLYNAWKEFSAFNGEPPGSQRGFAARLEKHCAGTAGMGASGAGNSGEGGAGPDGASDGDAGAGGSVGGRAGGGGCCAISRERTTHVRFYRGLRLLRPGERGAEVRERLLS